jgi:hypothetical protein
VKKTWEIFDNQLKELNDLSHVFQTENPKIHTNNIREASVTETPYSYLK